MKSIKCSFNYLMAVVCLLFLVSCLPKINTLTPTLPPKPSNTSTLEVGPTVEETITMTPTPSFVNPINGLGTGLYIVYWSHDMWQIKGVDNSIGIPQALNISSETYKSRIQLSHDGNSVSYSSLENQVSIYDLNTGISTSYSEPRQNFVFESAWSPDDQTLLCLGALDGPYPDSQIGIFGITPATGKTFTVLAWNNQFKFGLHGLAWSNDGKWIAFYASRTSEVESGWDPAVYVMDTACFSDPTTCSDTIKIVDDGYGPSWLPDGRLGYSCNGGSALCVIDINSSQAPSVVIKASDLINTPDAHFGSCIWSPDGKNIGCTLLESDQTITHMPIRRIFIIQANGNHPINLSNNVNESEFIEAWSSDSKYIAYSRVLGYTEPGGEYYLMTPITDIYIYNIENGETIDLIDESIEREVFGFFMVIK